MNHREKLVAWRKRHREKFRNCKYWLDSIFRQDYEHGKSSFGKENIAATKTSTIIRFYKHLKPLGWLHAVVHSTIKTLTVLCGLILVDDEGVVEEVCPIDLVSIGFYVLTSDVLS